MSKRSRDAVNNRANQKNPNNSAYWTSRNGVAVPQGGSQPVPNGAPPPSTTTTTQAKD